MSEKIISVSTRGILVQITLSEAPSHEFLDRFDGYIVSMPQNAELDKIQIYLYNVSESDLENAQTAVSALKDEGFQERTLDG